MPCAGLVWDESLLLSFLSLGENEMEGLHFPPPLPFHPAKTELKGVFEKYWRQGEVTRRCQDAVQEVARKVASCLSARVCGKEVCEALPPQHPGLNRTNKTSICSSLPWI